MKLHPYLFLGGQAEEAIALYQRVLGAELVALMRFRESPDPLPPGMIPPGAEDKVMHAEMRLGESVLMLSDGNCKGASRVEGVSLSLTMPDAAEADRVFAALGEGGQVQMPIGPTFFAPRFGMVADRFGVAWMVMVG